MKVYVKKPVRIEYYPKTKENVDSNEYMQVDEVLSKSLDEEITVEHIVQEEKCICQEYSSIKNEEIIEEDIEELEI
ncbi:hypothetical protein KQI88_16180 [Alkaliphilus sp. MSJ-5]|uniref:Uncharacterized protein n=1 Tax=Alkaliphilus flagellatus TaxID=2841507 RepID=A0ABS6G899_9FIRM|nr:hypothetical protein [Alkaliphilus flagellatus]MBU5677957.1 hypothetical protein [Alkaliphilus flagellatus]